MIRVVWKTCLGKKKFIVILWKELWQFRLQFGRILECMLQQKSNLEPVLHWEKIEEEYYSLNLKRKPKRIFKFFKTISKKIFMDQGIKMSLFFIFYNQYRRTQKCIVVVFANSSSLGLGKNMPFILFLFFAWQLTVRQDSWQCALTADSAPWQLTVRMSLVGGGGSMKFRFAGSVTKNRNQNRK